ncbi:hypothetical protein GGR56DRAFT_551109 [Xylariaceae sp. FL0804]|nr:hypothetical protein GGR56DRAFT_551109 [Xylariaceae sp. FL0804]
MLVQEAARPPMSHSKRQAPWDGRETRCHDTPRRGCFCLLFSPRNARRWGKGSACFSRRAGFSFQRRNVHGGQTRVLGERVCVYTGCVCTWETIPHVRLYDRAARCTQPRARRLRRKSLSGFVFGSLGGTVRGIANFILLLDTSVEAVKSIVYQDSYATPNPGQQGKEKKTSCYLY